MTRKPRRDWSKIALAVSLFLSVTIVTSQFTWELGKSLRTASYLKEHAVQTCAELDTPPAAPVRASAAVTERCTTIVGGRHKACVELTEHLASDLRAQRAEYMTCVMEVGVMQASWGGAERGEPR